MHVLFLPSIYPTADEPWRGTPVRDQAVALARAGVKVGVVFVERRPLAKLNVATLVASHFQTITREDDGVTTLRMKSWGAFGWDSLTRSLVRSYVDAHGRPDLVHAHGCDRVARTLGIPAIVTEEALPAVDIAYFHLPLRERKTTPFTFLAIAELARHIDVDVLLCAFARLRACNPRVRLVVAGEGPDQPRLRRIAAALRAQRAVQFVGALPRWQARQWMWEANALVVPRGAETSPRTEAMSTGLPAIDAAPHDEDSLQRAMEELISSRVDALALRETARRRFDYPIIAGRLRALYENVPLRRKEVA